MHRPLRGSRIAYEFGRQKRFPPPSSQCPVAFYQGPLDRDVYAVAPSFGIGYRSDFTRSLTDRNTPDPGLYTVKVQPRKKQGPNFGESRERVPDKDYHELHRKTNPGVGTYNIDLKGTQISYSIRRKTKDIQKLKLSYLAAPGPGKYQAKSLFAIQGKAFNGSKRPRFETEKSSTPGPGSYTPHKHSLRGCNQKTATTVRFGKESRQSVQDGLSCAPGPGAYAVPVQFGQQPVPDRKRFYSTFS